ncbi:hypothetical protein [uncultured Methanobrevibacter sp.]|uniref:hypothetical protein n=1 Tax=uncultured Methanobrevibacter sp. TaxID=253161 RepID=UPI00320A8AEB
MHLTESSKANSELKTYYPYLTPKLGHIPSLNYYMQQEPILYNRSYKNETDFRQ